MGKAMRWFKSLLGMKKERKENSNANDWKEKSRWSFGKSGRGSGSVTHIPATEAAWPRSYYTETEKEQNKHAIAVAAATAAAADAAVAAAQAAVAVVRLTSHGRGTMFGGARERWAAMKIQTVFRGYLARKALRALKGLVKLQALVRGYLVRKQATATLLGMQALIRAQTSVRLQKTRDLANKDHRFHPEFRPRKSIERYDDSRSEHTTSFHSRRLSASIESSINALDEIPKIVEIDTYRTKSRFRRTNTSMSDSCEDPHYEIPSSPFSCQILARPPISENKNCQDFDWGYMGDECRFSTAHSTPRFTNFSGSNAPVTPAKSICGYSNFPNYMANTQSFKAKLRSYSAPKQRPDPGPKKRFTLSEMVESRASLSGVRMRRSCSQIQEAINFKNAVMGRLDRSAEFVRESEMDDLHTRW